MSRSFKLFLSATLLVGGVRSSFGFALLGPVNEAYQVPAIGYNLDTDIGAPKNLGEEYRRNTPVMYYTCDANFWNYFGAKGVASVDAAFNVFNNLTGVDTWSSDLSEFPLSTTRHNYQAEALYLFDIKAWTTQLIIETLGLTEPVRYTWGIHERWLPSGTCPFNEEYFIIKRNFDPAYGTSLDQLKPTSYVNGVLFTYEIIEFCTAPIPPVAYCRPFPVDPLADPSTAVAEFFNFGSAFGAFSFSPYGLFYNGLTRDDVGGLRYLYRTNNVNFESAGPDSLVHVTNTTPTLLVTSNLTLLAAQALTNDAPTLQGIYPNLIILNTSNFFSNIFTTNFTAYFTNFPWDPVGTPPHLAFITNVTSSVATLFSHTFGNVLRLVNASTPSGWSLVPLMTPPPPTSRAWVTVQTTTVGVSNNPWGPVGSTTILTNTTSVTYQTNGVVGDFVILPTNWCEVSILSSQLTNVTSFTNPIVAATNFLGITNVAGSLLSITQNLINYFTNHYFVVYPIICQTNTAMYQGVEHTTFIRRDFDSLTGRFFQPLTNTYILNMVTNYTVIPQRVSRVVIRPDILVSAQDLTSGPDTSPPRLSALVRSLSYNTNQENLALAGPGTIESQTLNVAGFGPLPSTQFIFNNVGPLFINFGLVDTNAFLEEQSQIPLFLWASFDGTTNAPTLYPNDVSIFDLENQMLVPVTPQYLPVGSPNVSYSVELQTRDNPPNWQGPFTWSLAPNSPALPPGLNIFTDGYSSGNITGFPIQAGTFDFVLEITDSQGHTVDRSTFIQIGP